MTEEERRALRHAAERLTFRGREAAQEAARLLDELSQGAAPSNPKFACQVADAALAEGVPGALAGPMLGAILHLEQDVAGEQRDDGLDDDALRRLGRPVSGRFA